MDYQGNSKKAKKKELLPEKKVEKVVKSEVVIKKKPLGSKIKEIFVEADIKTVLRYVATDVLVPAARNMIVDASTKGIERLMYGETAVRRRNFGPGTGPRITYNSSPLHRDSATRPPSQIGQRATRRNRSDFILSSREEAEVVLEHMSTILDQYEFVSVADLHDLIGFPSSHVDNSWGWSFLGDVAIRPVREGYLLDFPPAEPIN